MIDTMLPGMVYGKIVMPPVRYGASVKSIDDSDARKVPGFIKAVVLDDKTATTTGWVVAVANTYANARKAAAALKVSYNWARTPRSPAHCWPRRSGCRPRATPGCSSSRTAICPRARQRRQGAGGGVHHQHQHPRAAGADERHGAAAGRHLLPVFRQSVRDAVGCDRGRGCRSRSEVRRNASSLARRRLRSLARRRHDGAGGAGRQGGRQACEGDLLARRRHRWTSRGRSPSRRSRPGSTATASSWRWSTTSSAPGRPSAGAFPISCRPRSTRRGRSMRSRSTARTSSTRCPTTTSAPSSTRWRRTPRPPASSALSRPVGRSGRSKA